MPGRGVGADVTVRQQAAVGVAVEPRRGVADVALEEEVAHAVGEIPVVVEDLADRREDALGELVDEVVGPEVAGGVGGVAVAEGEDLQLLDGVEAGVVLGRPCHVEDAGQPDAGVDRVDPALAHDHVGEPVGPDGAGEVVPGVLLDGLADERVDVVVEVADAQLAVGEHVVADVLGDLDVRERLEHDGRQRIARRPGVVVLVAVRAVGADRPRVLEPEQVPELVRGEVREVAAVLVGRDGDRGDVVAEDEGVVRRIRVAAVDLLRRCPSTSRPGRRRRRRRPGRWSSTADRRSGPTSRPRRRGRRTWRSARRRGRPRRRPPGPGSEAGRRSGGRRCRR